MSGAIRDVRPGPEVGALEFTLESGDVLHAVCHGVHQQEQQRVETALLDAFRASGIKVVAG